MPLIEDYIELQQKYELKYGAKTIVLYECGQFFEIYGIVNETETVGKIYEVADITNLSIAKRLDKFAPISRKNPLMAGFPNHSFEKWKDILLKHNYTIIKIEQDSHGIKDPNRRITEIISPGINIESSTFSNNLMSIYIEEIKTGQDKYILYSGVSCIDITTGDNSVYEINTKNDDNRYILDEIFRMIQTYNPSETIINCEGVVSFSEEYIINYLEISTRNLHFNNYESHKYMLENKYKNTFLEKIFPNKGLLTAVEYVDLDKMYWGLCSYIYLLQFSYDHNETIISNLNKPVIWHNKKNLILSYDSINQLNINPNKNIQVNTKIDSLWNLLNKTSTSLGKRLLHTNLLNPIIDKDELYKRYDLLEIFLTEYNNESIFILFENLLDKIFDIEKLHRRMTIGMLNPSSFINLDISYNYILKIFKTVDLIQCEKLKSILPEPYIINEFITFIEDYTSKINMDLITGFTQNNIKKSIFKRGTYGEIDLLQDKINECFEFFDKLTEIFAGLMSIDKISLKVKDSDKDGYHYCTTKKRGENLKNELNKKGQLTVKLNSGDILIDSSQLECKISTTTYKIFSPEIRSYSEKLNVYQEKMSKLCGLRFSELLQEYDDKYRDILHKIVEFISYIDFIKSNAKCSFKYGYTRPVINDKFDCKSYIKAENLRHPIIEELNKKLEYIPNNVDLGDKISGMLLYGVNAVGKSSYMKSVGLSVIMAQTGMFVPATNFEYYPYKYIFTRISGNDNIFKNQSTFAVEMSELRSILKRADRNSLILGDELCSGTETISGISIVTAGVITLEKRNCCFIFATHLHQLSSMPRLIELPKIKNYHMETIYDEAKSNLIYNRKIKEGSGNPIYGLEVAKAMDLESSFIDLANCIRKEVLKIDKNIVPKKTSQYNANIIIDYCKICKEKAEEVHHIKPQCIANNSNMIDFHHKNIEHNLIPLCHKCHQQVENGDLTITGYIQTLNGIEIDYKTIDKELLLEKKIKKRKYTTQQIEIIYQYKTVANNNVSRSKKLLELNNCLKVSPQIIKQIWNKTY